MMKRRIYPQALAGSSIVLGIIGLASLLSWQAYVLSEETKQPIVHLVQIDPVNQTKANFQFDLGTMAPMNVHYAQFRVKNMHSESVDTKVVTSCSCSIVDIRKSLDSGSSSIMELQITAPPVPGKYEIDVVIQYEDESHYRGVIPITLILVSTHVFATNINVVVGQLDQALGLAFPELLLLSNQTEKFEPMPEIFSTSEHFSVNFGRTTKTGTLIEFTESAIQPIPGLYFSFIEIESSSMNMQRRLPVRYRVKGSLKAEPEVLKNGIGGVQPGGMFEIGIRGDFLMHGNLSATLLSNVLHGEMVRGDQVRFIGKMPPSTQFASDSELEIRISNQAGEDLLRVPIIRAGSTFSSDTK